MEFLSSVLVLSAVGIASLVLVPVLFPLIMLVAIVAAIF